MKLSQFKFKLPQDKIAQYPAPHRDECRMMVLHRKTGEIEHRMFKDLLTYFDENDLFVFNDTKVFPARLYGNKEKLAPASRYSCCANSTRNCASGTCWLTLHAKSVSETNFILEKTIPSWPR